ncbi:MAG: tRNA (N(6)-L-threonylcarbamoyladenosine(37)-C(2))-methylthiotransferase MtaB [Alphaproteobacteria bacterium]
MSSVKIITFGCRLNTYESEIIRQNAHSAGLADSIIVNTCAVTAEAERQARQSIRKAKRDNPKARIVVTGCSAQIDPQGYAAMAEVDLVLGNDEKLRPESFLFDANPGEIIRVNDASAMTQTAGHLIDGFNGKSRAFVQVQNGCDHRCTFCIIPFGRGPSRSVPIGVIADQIGLLVANGYDEVVLTGVDITSYGGDLPGRPPLGQMLRRLLDAVPELPRLRLSSLDPAKIDADLWHLIAHEPRLMPHLHLSLQAGDDMILKRMKRRHSRRDAIETANRARRLRPDIVLGADFIAGFPTETDEMFDNTRRLVNDCGLSLLHVFPFSPRPGTPAARMPQLPRDIRNARARALRQAGADALASTLSDHVGRTAQVLVETASSGRTEHYLPVHFEDPQTPATILPTQMMAAAAQQLVGRPLALAHGAGPARD